VRDNAPGKSFVDVGGMFKLIGEIAFVAEEAGASSVTMFDAGDPDLICEGHPEWGWFNKKHADRSSKVRYVQGDLEDPLTPERVGVHDIVFCSGVLYHTPNPVLQLMQLRAMTRETLFLSTLTIPEIPGFPNACVFYPHLDDSARLQYAAGYSWAQDLLGIGPPVDERPMYGFGNCWFGITPSALRSMLRTARFEIERERTLSVSPFVTEVIARPIAMDPMMPPVSYFRERGEAAGRGEPRFTFEGWYEEQRQQGRDRSPATSSERH
jgi:hypothetical protein